MDAGKIYSDKAAEIAGDNLKIAHFIDTHWQNISERIEQCYWTAKNSASPNATFINETLTIVSAVINCGSSLEGYRSAKARVGILFPKADYVAVICRIVLSYIVSRGFTYFGDTGSPKKGIWGEMFRWIEETV